LVLAITDTFDQVVVIMMQRYERVLKKGNRDRIKLLFRSLATNNVQQSHVEASADEPPPIRRDSHTVRRDSHTVRRDSHSTRRDSRTIRRGSSTIHQEGNSIQYHAPEFTIDEATDDDDDDDGWALAALEALDATEAFKHDDAPIAEVSIPSDNLRKLIMLLLIIAPLGPQESLSMYADRLVDDQLEDLRRTAESILAAFINDAEQATGAKFDQFNIVIPTSLPFLFNGFSPLFEHFLFSKDLDFTKRKNSTSSTTSEILIPITPEPPLLLEWGDILDINVLSQLSLFLPGSSLFRQLRLLYSGGAAGFSMGSFETKVFDWLAPTILLIAGHRISDPPTRGRERSFSDTLPPKRFPDSYKSSRVLFGVYMTQPWRQTHKNCIGDADTLLFQLEPVHEVFHASSVNNDYVSFTKPPTSRAGIGVGCPHPKPKTTAGIDADVIFGAVSLVLDGSFEFGVFTHYYTAGGGAFRGSSTRPFDWQDRFEIESMEVWGCGGREEAERQKKRWEGHEAEGSRKVSLGTGDIEPDRALPEMTDIIGRHDSGGSITVTSEFEQLRAG